MRKLVKRQAGASPVYTVAGVFFATAFMLAMDILSSRSVGPASPADAATADTYSEAIIELTAGDVYAVEN